MPPPATHRSDSATGHWTVEPSLLAQRRAQRAHAGLRPARRLDPGDSAPTSPATSSTDKAGVSYTLYDGGCFRVCPIVEVLGWTCLSGKEFTGLETPIPTVVDAAGITVINAKVGVRVETDHQSIYVGYGRALTDAEWYRNMLRVEYRLKF